MGGRVYWFWGFVTEPLLTALRPNVIVEVGAWTGRTTEKLLTFAHSRQAALHVIDPAPRFDELAFQERWPGTMTLHRGLSHDILPELPPADAVLIDGDHNWFTVYNELRMLRQPYPLVLLHDVAWPYARRDVYYEPDRIPAEHRQPTAKAGVRPGKSELEPGGPNGHLHHAIHEGGPRNGVLTAIEDFMADAPEPVEFARIPGGHGLGILMPARLLKQREVREQWARLHSAEFLYEHCERLEAAADRRTSAVFDLRRQVGGDGLAAKS